MKYLLVLVSLLCISCTSDRYQRQELDPYGNQSITIRWKRVPDPNAYCRYVDTKMADISKDKRIVGCAHWSKVKPECTIATGMADDLAIIGHEVKHCFQGDWHR
jgi:hypothetical protein